MDHIRAFTYLCVQTTLAYVHTFLMLIDPLGKKGKYMEIHFGVTDQICSARISQCKLFTLDYQ